MSEATARTAVYNAVNGVTNIGVVHDYQRWGSDWGKILDLYKTKISGTEQIRGWSVRYTGFLVDEPPRALVKTGARLRRHNFVIEGFMGVDDSEETEKTFSALAEDVADAIDSDTTLHGSSYTHTSPASIDTFEARTFSGVLCHYAEITVTVSEMHVP